MKFQLLDKLTDTVVFWVLIFALPSPMIYSFVATTVENVVMSKVSTPTPTPRVLLIPAVKQVVSTEITGQFQKRLPLLNQTCEKGDGDACVSVARMFGTGYGGEQSEEFALAALDHGCELKHAESCHGIGHRFISNGPGKNHWDAAYNAFTLACSFGSEEACDDVKLIEEKTIGRDKLKKPADQPRRM